MTRDATGRSADGQDRVSHERRAHLRAHLGASAVAWTEMGGPMRYLVENLSTGGALLTGGPLLSVGERLSVRIHLERRSLGPLRATMVRAVDGVSVGVAFVGLSVEDEDVIQQTILEALEANARGARPRCRALVVDGSLQARQQLQRDLTQLGHGVISAATPLEAMMRLEDPMANFDVVLVDLRFASIDGLALLRYLIDTHPRTRRVLMSGEARIDQLKIAQFAGQAHAILPKPWDRTLLATAVEASAKLAG